VDGYLSWEKYVHLPPEHYGWVVEVELQTGKAKKLTALGRFAHECATCIVAADGRTVVYTGGRH
jgi:secreted PhoX family phosphatase